MTAPARVELSLLGQKLSVRSEAGAEYLQSLARFVEDRAVAIQQGGVRDPMSALALAAIEIADELHRLRDEPVPQDELDRARNYASGRLELKLEESRHVSAWLGVQEALHDRVLTLDEALAELAEVTPERMQAIAQKLFRDESLCMSVIAPPRSTSGLERALHLA